MKQLYIYSLAIAFSASAVAFISTQKQSSSISEKKEISEASHEGMEDDALERMNWELSRLADPATGQIPDNIRQKELAFAATLPSDAQSANRTSLMNITNRGPWNLGGRTRALGIDVSNESRILAGTPSGGMWLSNDGGATWNQSNTAAQLKNATCITQDTRPGHTNVWYYGSGEAYGASASTGVNGYYLGDGIFKSTDGGVSWSPVTSTAGGNPHSFTTNWQLVWNMAMDTTADDTATEVYAATYGAVYRSLNGGTSWTTVRSGGSYYTDVNVSASGVVYATMSDDGTQKGIWRSTDGLTFVNIMPAAFGTAYNRIVSGINPSNENEVYFLANTPGFGKVTYNYLGDAEWNSLWKYTYISGDGSGANGTWQDLSMNLPNTGGQFDRWQVQGSYDMVVKVKPNDPNTVFIGGTNLYRSTSGFQDSTHTSFIGGYQEFSALPVINSYPNHHPDQHCLQFFNSNPDMMLSSNDGGVFKTTDNTASSVAWQPLNNGYLTSMFYTCAVDHASPGNNIIIGGAQDNGSWWTNSANATTPWVQPRSGDGSYCAIADNQSAYYFSIQNAKMMKATLDGAGNVTTFARIDPIGLKDPQFVNPYTLDPNNNNIMYLAGGKYLWRNDDLSGVPMIGNWDSISTNWTRFADSVPTANSKITAVHACKATANRVYYGTDKKKIYRVDNANVGTPTPVDITPISGTGAFPATGYVSCITSDPLNSDRILVVFSNYAVYSLYYSPDGGVTWSKVAGNLEVSSGGTGAGPSLRWASIMHVSDGTAYLVATSTGLYATDTLNGLSTVWVQQGASTIGNSVCDMIDTRDADGLVVVATHASGIYSANITSINDIATGSTLASSEEMELNNYPNPVKDATTISFSLKKKAAVHLEVWDECGRVVTTLVNEAMAAGNHTLNYSPENLKPGIYYYSLTADNKRKTKSMILVK